MRMMYPPVNGYETKAVQVGGVLLQGENVD